MITNIYSVSSGRYDNLQDCRRLYIKDNQARNRIIDLSGKVDRLLSQKTDDGTSSNNFSISYNNGYLIPDSDNIFYIDDIVQKTYSDQTFSTDNSKLATVGIVQQKLDQLDFGLQNYALQDDIKNSKITLKYGSVISSFTLNQSSDKTIELESPNNPTITLKQGGVKKGSFTLNQSTGAEINLDGVSEGVVSINPGTNIDVDGNTVSLKSTLTDITKITASNGFYVDTKKVALQDDIKNSTVTLKQGGVEKGSFTLNQSSSVEIDLDKSSKNIFACICQNPPQISVEGMLWIKDGTESPQYIQFKDGLNVQQVNEQPSDSTASSYKDGTIILIKKEEY